MAGGFDIGFTGGGSKRQQWITYRDSNVYSQAVRRGPLFPISSLMLHGIIISNLEHAVVMDAAVPPDEGWPSMMSELADVGQRPSTFSARRGRTLRTAATSRSFMWYRDW